MSYDRATLASLVESLEAAGSTTTRGHRLQDLVDFLVEDLSGVETVAPNRFNIGRTEEKDVWLRHARESAGMPFDDRDVPVECKNEGSKTSPNEVAWFGEKIRNSGGRDGVLVTKAGLSGDVQSGGHEEVRRQLAKGTRIIMLTVEELALLRSGADLLALLTDRFTELRHLQGYRSL